MKSVIAAVAAVALLAALPAGASASSVIDQYIEQVPSGGGGKPSSDVRNDASGGGSGSAAAGGAASASGTAGTSGSQRERDLAAVFGGTAGEGKNGGGQDLSSRLERSSADPGLDRAFASLLGSDRGGTGLLLPALMLASLAAAGVAVRRRSRADGTSLGD